jgi:GNAT superfamily N-acetyltransferase
MTTLIRLAGVEDVPALHAGLSALSADLGDPWLSTHDDLRDAGFGARPSFAAVLAEGPDGLMGCAIFSPIYSTMRAAPGLFVSDLWAAPAARGTGMGPRLLAAAAAHAGDLWGARWLKLSVHKTNPRARTFYDRLGFVPDAGLDTLVLEADAFNALGDT